MNEPIIVICFPGCNGTRDLCIPMIREIADSGKTAFMMYSEHVREKVEALGYHTRVKMQHDIPVGLYIQRGNIEGY